LALAIHWTLGKWRILDISDVFPNTVIARVIHNMCGRQILVEYTEWATGHMTGHKTILTFKSACVDDTIFFLAGTTSHKFLSIYLDQALNFKEHANYALGKCQENLENY
jgi:hypothetical protein